MCRDEPVLLTEGSMSPKKQTPFSLAHNHFMPIALDFFAGSGLVTEGLSSLFRVAWANDICPKKAAIYTANFQKIAFTQGPIESIKGDAIPNATLSWASFPCQDLSLAGNLNGIRSSRSGLVWHWLRVMDEMDERPPILVAENVVGLVSAAAGRHYKRLHGELIERGYRAGAVIIDAISWVPQSRPRVFVIAVDERLSTLDLESSPSWCHPSSIRTVAKNLKNWIWWKLPEPSSKARPLENILDLQAPKNNKKKSSHNLRLISEKHLSLLKNALSTGQTAFPGYKRTRNGRQVLELRFDNIAGCLRTPQGGSSRQLLVLRRNRQLVTRLITVREAARLMGVRETFKIPGSYNDGYRAMGDAVAVPVVRFLSRHLLASLSRSAH